MFVIRVAPTAHELREVQCLRASVYGADELEDPKNFTADGRYVDSNDDWSVHVAARTLDELLIGSLKVTPRSEGRPMKLESDVPAGILGITDGMRCVEVSRLAVANLHRRQGVALGLWQVAFRWIEDNSYTHVFALQRDEALGPQEHIGLPVRRLSDKLTGQYGLQLTPTCMSVADTVPALMRANPSMGEFFATSLPGGLFDPRTVLRAPRRVVPTSTLATAS